MNITNIILGIVLLFFGLLLIWKAPSDGKLIGLGCCGTGALLLLSSMSSASNEDDLTNNKST